MGENLLPVRIRSQGGKEEIPEQITFLEMYGVKTTEELDIFARNCPSPYYLSILDAITPWSAPDELYEKVERLPDINDMEEYDIVVERSIGENGVPGIMIAGNDYNINEINCTYYRKDEETGKTHLEKGCG